MIRPINTSKRSSLIASHVNTTDCYIFVYVCVPVHVCMWAFTSLSLTVFMSISLSTSISISVSVLCPFQCPCLCLCFWGVHPSPKYLSSDTPLPINQKKRSREYVSSSNKGICYLSHTYQGISVQPLFNKGINGLTNRLSGHKGCKSWWKTLYYSYATTDCECATCKQCNITVTKYNVYAQYNAFTEV